MTKRVFLYGFYGIGNAGNEAMLKALTDPIRDALSGDVEFVVASRHPDPEYDELYGVKTVPNLEYASREQSMGRWLRGLNPDDAQGFEELLRTLASCDLAVVGPGQFLVETGTKGLLKGSLAQIAAVATACTLTRTPLYGLALACEPLGSSWSRLLVDRLLPLFDRLTFRDPRSIMNLEQAGVQVPEHEVLGDLALAGAPAPLEAARERLAREQVPDKKGARLAVALRSLYWLGDTEQEIMAVVRDGVIAWLEADADRDVVLVPQCTYTVDGGRDDDRPVSRGFRDSLPEHLRGRVHLLEGEALPEETESIYGLCDVTLSLRLHAAVFSCKQGTPPVMMAFMDKTRGFFARIRHEQSVMEMPTTAQDLSKKLEEALVARDVLSSSLKEAVGRVRTTASRYPEIAVEMLRSEPAPRRAWVKEVLRGT